MSQSKDIKLTKIKMLKRPRQAIAIDNYLSTRQNSNFYQNHANSYQTLPYYDQTQETDVETTHYYDNTNEEDVLLALENAVNIMETAADTVSNNNLDDGNNNGENHVLNGKNVLIVFLALLEILLYVLFR